LPVLEYKGLLQCSQDPTAGPCPLPDEPGPDPHTLFNIHFNIIFLSSPRFSNWFFCFRFCD